MEGSIGLLCYSLQMSSDSRCAALNYHENGEWRYVLVPCWIISCKCFLSHAHAHAIALVIPIFSGSRFAALKYYENGCVLDYFLPLANVFSLTLTLTLSPWSFPCFLIAVSQPLNIQRMHVCVGLFRTNVFSFLLLLSLVKALRSS
jgi:hypothetical protein